MHKILFRAKKKEDDQWVKGTYVCLNGIEHRIYDGYAETDCGDYYPDWYSIDVKTLCQFTGLYGRNEIPIFEYDVVRILSDTFEFTGFVVFTQGCFQLVDLNCDVYELLWYQPEEMTVLGNVFDNPELVQTN